MQQQKPLVSKVVQGPEAGSSASVKKPLWDVPLPPSVHLWRDPELLSLAGKVEVAADPAFSP